MDEREGVEKISPHVAAQRLPDPRDLPSSPSGTGSLYPANDELLQGTGSIPLAASASGGAARSLLNLPEIDQPSAEDAAPSAPESAPASSAPRYVRKRTPHVDQGTVDDLGDDSEPAPTYTHDSNIAVGGSTPLSGMAYRRSRSNMTRVRNGSRYGQYLEIPKGRRSIFASRERARRRRSVLALLAVITVLVMAAIFLWNMMQAVLD